MVACEPFDSLSSISTVTGEALLFTSVLHILHLTAACTPAAVTSSRCMPATFLLLLCARRRRVVSEASMAAVATAACLHLAGGDKDFRVTAPSLTFPDTWGADLVMQVRCRASRFGKTMCFCIVCAQMAARQDHDRS